MSVELLLCEDNLGDIYLIEDFFTRSKTNYIINKLTNGSDVMGYLRQENQYRYATRPDIVILDLNLPGKHGLEILEEIKADSLLKTIPIVVLTSSKARHDVLTAEGGQRRHRRLRRQSLHRLALRQRTCPHVCQSFALCAVYR